MDDIRIVIAGDFASQNRVQNKINSNKYEDILEDVKPIIERANYSIVNFETTIPSEEDVKIPKVGPYLSTTSDSFNLLKYAGFDCLALANNHIRDFGDGGIANVIANCNEYKLDYIGVGSNIKESQKILYKQISNKKIAFINICEIEFSIATKTSFGAAPIDLIDNYNQIKEARRKADYVIMIIHGGSEYIQLPSLRMVKTYRFFVDLGVDAIINHHQHCFGGFEIYKDKPIFYGLGNFCFDYPDRFDSVWNEGYMVELIFTTKGINYKIYPYEQCNKCARVILLSEHDRTNFMTRINEINAVIKDHSMLKKHMDIRLADMGKSMIDAFEPYNNRVLRWLHRKGFLPSFINDKKKLVISHYISCESHRDKLMAYLKIFK